VLLALETFWHIGGQEAFLVTAVVAVPQGWREYAMQDFRPVRSLERSTGTTCSEAAGELQGRKPNPHGLSVREAFAPWVLVRT
jgi:hypothetical protein